jgi:hypothetical protein
MYKFSPIRKKKDTRMSVKEKLKDHLWSAGTGIAGIAGVIGIIAATAFVFSVVSLAGTIISGITAIGLTSGIVTGLAAAAAGVTVIGATAEVFGHGMFKFLGGKNTDKGLIHSVAQKAQNFKPVSTILGGIGTLAGAFLLASSLKANEPPPAPVTETTPQSLQIVDNDHAQSPPQAAQKAVKMHKN